MTDKKGLLIAGGFVLLVAPGMAMALGLFPAKTEATDPKPSEPEVPTRPPERVTEGWCDELGAHLANRYIGNARAEQAAKRYSERAPDDYLQQIISDHTKNVVVNCKDDAGQPTAGYWSCIWDSTLGNYKECKRPPKIARLDSVDIDCARTGAAN